MLSSSLNTPAKSGEDYGNTRLFHVYLACDTLEVCEDGINLG